MKYIDFCNVVYRVLFVIKNMFLLACSFRDRKEAV